MKTIEQLMDAFYDDFRHRNMYSAVGFIQRLCDESGVKFEAVKALAKIFPELNPNFIKKALVNCSGELTNFISEYTKILIEYEDNLPEIDCGDSEYAEFYEVNQHALYDYVSNNFKYYSDVYKDNFKIKFVKHWLKMEFPGLTEKQFEIIHKKSVELGEAVTEWDFNQTVYEDVEYYFKYFVDIYNELKDN